MQNRITVPFYNNHRHKIILDAAVCKAVKMLTGRKAFTEQDRQALELLGVGLVHVNDMASEYRKLKK